MSKIIRAPEMKKTVYIGDRHRNMEMEGAAEQKMAEIFPFVSIITDSGGARLIPIQEIMKIDNQFKHEKEILWKERFEEGYREGYRKGLKEGTDKGEAKAKNVVDNFSRAIQDTISQRESLYEESKHKILELVMQISRKVTFDAIMVDPEKTLDIINGAIKQLVDRSSITLKVHPDHLPLVEQNLQYFLQGSTAIKEINIKPDPRIQYGGCFIETPTGDVDARLESQFEVIENTLCSDEDRQ